MADPSAEAGGGAKSKVFAVLTAAFLAWRGADSCAWLVRETTRVPLVVQVGEAFGPLEARLGRTLGPALPAFRALVEHVPEHALVVFLHRPSGPAVQDFLRLQTLAYPRQFLHLMELPPGWEPRGRVPEREVWVLDYDSGFDFRRDELMRFVARFEGGSLWRMEDRRP